MYLYTVTCQVSIHSSRSTCNQITSCSNSGKETPRQTLWMVLSNAEEINKLNLAINRNNFRWHLSHYIGIFLPLHLFLTENLIISHSTHHGDYSLLESNITQFGRHVQSSTGSFERFVSISQIKRCITKKLAFFFTYFTAISELNAREIVEYELGTTLRKTDVACVTMQNTIVILPKFWGKGPLHNFKIFRIPTTCW